MTPEQYTRYTAAMITGYTSGVGGSTWTYYPPPSDEGVTGAVTITQDGTRTLYIVQEKLATFGQPLPSQPVGTFQWRMVAPIDTDVEAGGVVASGGLAFAIGTLDTDQGFPTAIVTKTSVPDRIVTPATIIAAFQVGLRIGAF